MKNKHNYIRNFSIIAHIDHGKSTLADRIMEMTQTVSKRDLKDQMLDSMDVEREHGITVKSRTVRVFYQARNGQEYKYNLLDTPGHVDFSYEVSKSLAASEGVILLVDATQGVQAQTIANYQIAKENHLVIIPVINKMDSPNANMDQTRQQIIESMDFNEQDILYISAKTGQGVADVLERIQAVISPPAGSVEKPLKALVFDLHYDPYKGVIAYIRLFEGSLDKEKTLVFMATQAGFEPIEIGVFSPHMQSTGSLSAGEVGYIVTGLKEVQRVKLGDTLTSSADPVQEPLPGYKESKSTVFAGFYPSDDRYKDFENAIHRLALNDSSFRYEEEQSDLLGKGFRCGFLGMLHLQIIRERLEKEYGVTVLTTAPNVSYHVIMKNGKELWVNNPVNYPPFVQVERVEEPFSEVTITLPEEYIGDMMKLVTSRKGIFYDLSYQSNQAILKYEMPASEIAYDFFDQLKSISRGYATMDVKYKEYRTADLVKAEILVNYLQIDALAFILHREDVYRTASELVLKLKHKIPRKLYPMPVQVLVEGKVIAREDVPPLRKNAAVSGEKKSISKKQALLRRQNMNKRKMESSDIRLPQEVFNTILEMGKGNN
ncbi:translation elongation factor 4 [Paenibacillus kribbensis]|uniref:translation elongation factor 4 n=1 Tax=Paenibacillus TaxID=44249 RepID=UPI00024EF5DC|nr:MULTISPECIES: translation elongation factor 4 [Paenibacillus]EHS57712.1 GTP-binding protein LepA [Paenibacillus sp. Aloe-11]MEC0236604.1 translation elongation factor 4 [Paenibacillus kribbensis]